MQALVGALLLSLAACLGLGWGLFHSNAEKAALSATLEATRGAAKIANDSQVAALQTCSTETARWRDKYQVDVAAARQAVQDAIVQRDQLAAALAADRRARAKVYTENADAQKWGAAVVPDAIAACLRDDAACSR